MYRYSSFSSKEDVRGVIADGVRVEYMCLDGFVLVDATQFSLTCLDGQWDGPIPTCGMLFFEFIL